MTKDVANQTILVTGGAGFIGSHLVRWLLNEGVQVINVDNFNDYYDPVMKRLNVEPFQPLAGQSYHQVEIDITNKKALDEVFQTYGKSIDQVVHLAAWAGVRPSFEEPELYHEHNVTATQYVLEAMKAHNIRKMVFASSSSVYGSRTDPPFREDQDISKPVSVYAATKAMCESLLHTYCHLWDMQVVALRFFTVYGPAQRPDLAIHKFTNLIAHDKPVPVYGDGSALRDYTYIDDILQGLVSALSYTEKPYETFNLGESDSITVIQLVEKLSALLNKPVNIEHHPWQPGDVPMTCADISKARSVLGYKPTTPIDDGLAKFVAWYHDWQKLRQSVGERNLVS